MRQPAEVWSVRRLIQNRHCAPPPMRRRALTQRTRSPRSSSVVNQRTRIINNFLRECQDSNTVKASRQWGEFLRGQKPGMTPGSSNAHPTGSQLRSEARTDAAPPPRLSENPAAVRGMSFGWLLENLNFFQDEQQSASPPGYSVEEVRAERRSKAT